MSWSALGRVVLVALVAFGTAALVTSIGVAIALRPLRRLGEAPWIERARLAYPARGLVTRNLIVIVVLCAEGMIFSWMPGLGWTSAPWVLLAGVAGTLGVAAVGRRLEIRLCRRADGRPATGVPLFALMVLPTLLTMGVLVALIPRRWGPSAAAVLALGAVLMTFTLCGGWLIVFRRFGWIRSASPRLAAIVERVAERAGVRPRRTLEMASPNANALAYFVPQILVFTAPLVEILDDDELAAVTGHELGHLTEPRLVFLARVVGFYLLLVATAGIPLAGSFGLWAGLAPPLVLVAGAIVLRHVARRMEERSDRMGREHEGSSEGTYAKALEKIYEANLIPAVLRGKRQVHPHLYDRLIASGLTPAYARPAPPPGASRASLAMLTCAALVVLGLSFIKAAPDPRRAGAGPALWERAREAYEENDLESAAQLYSAATVQDSPTPLDLARFADALVRLGRFAEASAIVAWADALNVSRRDHSPETDALLRRVHASLAKRRPAAVGIPPIAEDRSPEEVAKPESP